MAEPSVMNNVYRVTLVTGARDLSDRLIEADDLEILPNGALTFCSDVQFVDPRCSGPEVTQIAWFAPGSWHSVLRVFTGVTGGEWTAWLDEGKQDG